MMERRRRRGVASGLAERDSDARVASPIAAMETTPTAN